MIDPLSSLPGYVLSRAAAASLTELNRGLAKFGLRHSDVSLLILVEVNPKLTQSDAGKLLDIQRANMVPLVARLLDRSLISKEPVDGRSQGLLLTGKGKKLLREVKAVVDHHERELELSIPERLRPHLLPILNALWDSIRSK
ncbi:MarR family transcriptional regulator [Parasphingorhabdus sp.]|uniref:MarR family winged helix-turn-helix transcriptional regulator n=1 Tax=Parasphingorhabdus sp. TaxID=2709688 RepID=UPI0032631AE2